MSYPLTSANCTVCDNAIWSSHHHHVSIHFPLNQNSGNKIFVQNPSLHVIMRLSNNEVIVFINPSVHSNDPIEQEAARIYQRALRHLSQQTSLSQCCVIRSVSYMSTN